MIARLKKMRNKNAPTEETLMLTLYRKIITSACAVAALLSIPATPVVAAALTNGDFETGDFTGWSLDTDGFPGSGNDFKVVGSPGSYSARVEADYWDPPGDIFGTPLNDVFFANTLYQELDTTVVPGEEILLSFDWVFNGEDGDPSSSEIFFVGLNDGTGDYYGADGTLGFLIDPTTSYGNGSFTTLLDVARFGNASGWYLDFQLGVGADAFGEPNGVGSFVEISNVGLEAVRASAPTPATWLLLAAGVLGAAKARKRSARNC